MKYASDKLKEEAFDNFDRQQLVSFATVEGDQPRVRTVTVIHLEGKFFVATRSNDAKVKQIEESPKAEFCLLIKNDGKVRQLRAKCSAKIVNNRKVKSKVYNEISWMKDYFETPDDPAYTLIKLHPISFEYKKPGMQTVKIEL